MNGNVGGLCISDLPHHDHVRILANESAQGSGKRETDLRLDLRLVDAGNLILNGVFDGQNLSCRVVEYAEHGRKRCRLTAARWPGDDDQAVRKLEEVSELGFVRRRQAKLGDFENASIFWQQSDDGRFSKLCRHGRDADVDV